MMKTKKALYHSGIALLVCISMFIGSTFAWFSDSISSGKNVITAGNLDLEMYWTDNLDSGKWYNVEEDGHNTIFNYDNWEPGYTDVKYIKLVNAGSLALNYKLSLTPEDGVGKLAEVINVYYAEGGVELKGRSDLQKMRAIGLLDNILNGGATADGTLLAEDQYSPLHPSGEVIMTVALNMLTTAGNEYQNEDSGKFTITALATQAPFEEDSFGKDYDANAEYPVMLKGDSAVAPVTPINGKVPAGGVTLSGSNISAFVPEGTEMEAGADKLTLKVTPLEKTTSDIIVVNNEILIPVDVHIDGVAESNTVPIIVNLGEILPKYLNMGNYHLYHIENGTNSVMQLVADASALTAHNTFTYDPLTGAVSVAMASFSEVTAVAYTTPKWSGKQDDTWYDAKKTELTIANADQLYSFAKIVGGMVDGIAQDSFSGKTVTLLSDINLNHGTVVEGGIKRIFYPVGYYNDDKQEHKDENDIVKDNYDDKTGVKITSGIKNFEGTFDGAGHTISNIYQNTWEMKGDHDWYAPEDQHYRDGMGVFGRVYGGTIKNLTVDNFESDGEITTTGVVASYADGATFENIAITNCNPRVYNIGNGGIVGCVGWYAKEANLKTTFTNITIDSTNMISALWGSYDVACGGIVGQYYPTSGQTSAGSPKNKGIHFENCHVAAVMDVYNDVCANYQYYAYRYAGMIIGSIRENETIDGRVYPKMEGITAKGCTVHYDTWNDYFYCELVANTLASYTHDHQFSRLERVAKVEGTTITPLNGNAFTVPNSGRYNYVVVNGEFSTQNATCYHFVDGKVWNHADAGTETVNGVAGVLKEDKQHIYLPFTQLFTGYGWGVTSKGIEDFVGIETMDITKSQQKDSVEKFASRSDIDLSKIEKGGTVSVSDLFVAINNAGVEIKNETVMVAVTDLTNTKITADFTRGNTWDKGILKFNGTDGFVKITIQDYYFCKPTSVIVKVGDFDTTDRFAVVFPNTEKYLYRVGNQNTVLIGSLFKSVVDQGIGNVSIDVETTNGNVSVTNTPNSTWTNGTLQFSGTGVVNITISDDNFSTPVTLPVEVVDAKNIVSYSELKDGQNSVLLNDISMSTNGTYRLTGKRVLYGNGFVFDVTKGAYTSVQYDYMSYVIFLEDSRLDNVQIKGAVYPEIGSDRSKDYNRAIVMTDGNCSITNSLISNGASPIRNGGDLELVNTTLKGGIYANLDQRNGHLILDNVTTINQIGANDKYNGTTEKVGMGIVVYQEGGTEELKITIRNKLTQYNYLSKTQADTYLTDTYQEVVKSVVFGTDFKEYQNDGLVNLGIISMNNYFTKEDLVDERADKNGYSGKEKTITLVGETRNCYVYTFKPTSNSAIDYPGYVSAGQGAIKPYVDFDFVNKNYQPKTEDSNDYCYEDGGKVFVSMDDGDTFNWDTSILTVTKNGKNLSYTVSVNGSDYTGKSFAYSQSGTYEVKYSFTDDYNYRIEGDKVSAYAKTYTETVIIEVTVVEAAAKHAEFSFGANGTAYKGKTVAVGDRTYVMPDVSATVSGKIGSTTVNGTTIYYPITEMYTSDGKTEHTGSWYACFPIFKDAVQIVDYADGGTGDAVTYNQAEVTTVAKIPSTLKATNPKSAFLYQMNSTNYSPPTDPTAVSGAVCYTSNRKGLTSSNTRKEMTIIAEYEYTDNIGSVYYYYVGYHCEEQTKGNTCITSDTLITLADGSQKRIDEVTYDDRLLVWDFNKGEYTFANSSIIENHGYDWNEVIALTFADGTKVKVVNAHGFFDANLNKWVDINATNANDYVGHNFTRIDGSSYKTVKLVSTNVTNEYVEAWSILTMEHYNCIAEGMFSITPPATEQLAFFEIGDAMKYDAEAKQADIEKYGLFTYEEFAEYMTYEQFDVLNVAEFKVAIGKGMITYEELLWLIATYIK